MKAKLIKFLEDLRASYWFVPMCMVMGALFLAVGARKLDASAMADTIPNLQWLQALGPDDARTILSVIATGVLGVAGVTFSITIVAVSFASSNFGPRLIGNFMRDRGSQFTLGTFIGTFVYSLSILSNIHASSTSSQGVEIAAFVPHLSILLALLLMLASIAILIFFIHHIAEIINIENIIAAIGLRLKERINDVYPGTEPSEEMLSRDFTNIIVDMELHAVDANRIGYVQAINHEKLAAVAASNDVYVSVHYRPGDFVSNHDCMMSVWSEHTQYIPADELRQCFVTDQQRTEHQNVLFLVEQLGEVIARALSPGVNDPFTAISCLNWYRTALFEYLAAHKDQPDNQQWHRRRIQLLPVTFERLTSVMFEQTRQYIASDTNVVLHTLALLTECASFAGPGSHQQVLEIHLENIQQAAIETLGDSIETRLVSRRFSEARQIISTGLQPGLDKQQHSWFGGSA